MKEKTKIKINEISSAAFAILALTLMILGLILHLNGY